MIFKNFQLLFPEKRFFTTQEALLRAPSLRRPTLTDWQRQGFIRNIARGLWEFRARKTQEEHLWVASGIIDPHSYVSLETALRLYNFIPEEVYVATCVTTQKMQRTSTPLGNILYKTIPKRAYIGYELKKIGNEYYRIATTEKALADYLWVHSDIDSLDAHEEMRWTADSIRTIDITKLRMFGELFQTKPYLKRLEMMIQYFSTF